MSQPATNPVHKADFLKLMDPSKMMDEFKMPGFDINALMEMQRKNIEAITAVNKTVFESLQSFAQRQAELMRQGFEETSHLMQAITSAQTPQEKALCLIEASKNTVDKCMANARDAADTLVKCNNQAMETVSHCMGDDLNDLRGMTKTGRAA